MVHKAILDTQNNIVNVNSKSLNATALMPEVRNARKKLADDMKGR